MVFEKYTTKPVTVESIQFLGEVIQCLKSDTRINWSQDGNILVKTIDGDDTCSIGDYIVRGSQGELYVVKEALFLETHDKCDCEVTPRARKSKTAKDPFE